MFRSSSSRGAHEPYEGCIWQHVAHAAGKTVNEIVLAAVRFVGDDHDVTPVREHRMAVALLLRKKLVDGGEHHTTRRHGEQLAQVRPAFRLHRRLTQEVLAAGKRPKELVVQIVAVGEHHDGRVLHRRLADDASGVKRHGQTLAAALGVPDHADAPVAGLAAGLARSTVAAARNVSSTATRTAWNWW